MLSARLQTFASPGRTGLRADFEILSTSKGTVNMENQSFDLLFGHNRSMRDDFCGRIRCRNPWGGKVSEIDRLKTSMKHKWFGLVDSSDKNSPVGSTSAAECLIVMQETALRLDTRLVDTLASPGITLTNRTRQTWSSARRRRESSCA